MKLIEGSPPALPGQCYLCGSASREVYVDLETDVEFHGAMYLCNECVREMGVKMGMLPREKANDLNLRSQTMEIELSRLRDELGALKDVADAVGHLKSVISDSHGSGSESASGEVPAVGESGDAVFVFADSDGPFEPSNDKDVV